MDKKGFVESLASAVGCSLEEAARFNSILEEKAFPLSSRTMDKIVDPQTQQLGWDRMHAEEAVGKAAAIIKNEVKTKLKNPFGHQ